MLPIKPEKLLTILPEILAKNPEFINIIPDIHKNISELQAVVEQEETKRKMIEKNYQLKVKEIELTEKLVMENIEKRHKENLSALKILEKALDKNTSKENIEEILSTLNSILDRKYIDDETFYAIKNIKNSKDDDFIDIFPENEY